MPDIDIDRAAGQQPDGQQVEADARDLQRGLLKGAAGRIGAMLNAEHQSDDAQPRQAFNKAIHPKAKQGQGLIVKAESD